jgi:hypothetical protein
MSLKSKTTPWFPWTAKPVREGVYQRKHNVVDKTFYSYWDGKYWGRLAETPKMADYYKHRISMFQNVLPWRGLVEGKP